MLKIKKDDMVRIIAGKDKGKDGKVLSVDAAKHKIVVEGCNVITKHTKPGAGNPQGGIVKLRLLWIFQMLCFLQTDSLPRLASRLKMARRYVLPRRPARL